MRQSKPFFIKGAGAEQFYAEVKKRGGNSARTWRGDAGVECLNEAERCGLTVYFGIWIEPVEWFRYDDERDFKRDAVAY